MKTYISSTYIYFRQFKKEWITNVCYMNEHLLADSSDNDAEMAAGKLWCDWSSWAHNTINTLHKMSDLPKGWNTELLLKGFIWQHSVYTSQVKTLCFLYTTPRTKAGHGSSTLASMVVCIFHILVWPSAAKLELFYTVTLIFSVFYSFRW